jgi:hypothetical protein
MTPARRGAADRRQHRQAAGDGHRIRREPLARCRPTGRGSPVFFRHSARFLDPRGVLDPSGSADPGRGEVEESVPVFRISRRLGPGQALTRVGAVLLRGHGHAEIALRWGDAEPNEEVHLSKIAHLQCVIPAVATVSAGRIIATKKPRAEVRGPVAFVALYRRLLHGPRRRRAGARLRLFEDQPARRTARRSTARSRAHPPCGAVRDQCHRLV